MHEVRIRKPQSILSPNQPHHPIPFQICLAALLVASACASKTEGEKVPLEKKLDKRGLLDLGYGYGQLQRPNRLGSVPCGQTWKTTHFQQKVKVVKPSEEKQRGTAV